MSAVSSSDAPLIDAPDLPGWDHVVSGKVRELYVPAGADPATAEEVLVLATDRISAYDHSLQPGIPDKVRELLEPEQADPGEQAALVGDAGLQGVVVGADAVGGDHQHLLRGRRGDARRDVQLADLPGDDVVPARQLRGLDQGCGGAHAVSSLVPSAPEAARRAMSVR